MKELSKEILEKEGIRVEQDPYEECGYKIYRYGRKAGRAKELTWKRLNTCLNGKYHKKSGKMKWYWIVGFSDNNKPKAYPLHRLLYAWYIGYVPANLDVDHIDNNSLNNDLSNLQLSTRKDNLAKREGFKNQWDAMKANEEADEVTIEFSDGSKMTFSGMNNESTLTESQTKLVSRLEEAAVEDGLPDLKAGLENLNFDANDYIH